MIVAPCPACRENVTVPIDARPESIVRCPLCSAECRLSAFLAQLPPPLIVVADAELTADAAPAEALLGAAAASDGEAVAFDTGAACDSSESIPAFNFAPGSAEVEAPSVPRDVPRRAARRQKSMAWEMAKIIGGAILAVPAAQIILWWFVPYDWKRDLLGIGPSISRVVPWIVPQKFRDSFDEEILDSARVAADQRSIASPRRRPPVPTRDRPTASLASGTERPPSRALASPASPEDRAVAESTDIPPPATAPMTTTEPPATAGRQPSEESAGAVPDAPGMPKYGSSELQIALEQALQASVSWDTSPDQTEAHRANLNDEFYAAFAHLGEILAFMRPGEDNARELAAAVRELLMSFARQPKKLVLIGSRGADWLDRPDRPNQGVFLFGTVRQIQPEGQLYATELELASPKKRSITVFSHLDPQSFYTPGDRILMLGALIEPPAGQPPAAAIVLGSFPIRLPQ
jgi:hypothetical protein